MLAVGPFGPFEAILILVIVITIFGAGRLGQVGGAVGRSIREFRKSAREPGESHRAPAGKTIPPLRPEAVRNSAVPQSRRRHPHSTRIHRNVASPVTRWPWAGPAPTWARRGKGSLAERGCLALPERAAWPFVRFITSATLGTRNEHSCGVAVCNPFD
jgi:sec-independent protein translocase protein TatA